MTLKTAANTPAEKKLVYDHAQHGRARLGMARGMERGLAFGKCAKIFPVKFFIFSPTDF